ncbi:response regulator [candidate division WOR-3 bacterium]|nr:response regulator [candidate division WOR-3 bacterium]MCK4525787.1 response regulator [candidate division WOR-3 bacterium]
MPRVLIVDDEPSILYLFKEFFKLKDFEVDTADNGLEALKKLHNNKYHLMILDVKMGEKHGLEVLEDIIDRGYDFPIIMCTAFGHLKQDVDIIAGDKMDVDFITKPLDLEELWSKTVSLLKSHAIKTDNKLGSST